MTSPRIPLSVPDLRGREAELLAKCVAEGWVSSAGPEVVGFEADIARLTGRRHAVAVVNGTAALHLTLIASGVKARDRVIVPDWTFAASANAVAHAGAVPVLVDVRASDWGLDPALVADALRADAGIRAVIAVDPLGHAADFAALADVCREYRVALIEDAAGAIGGTYRGRPCGSLGDVSTFSFNGNKTITAGGGGMVMIDDDATARWVRHLSTQARVGREYLHDAVGFNYRMTNLNAAVGLAQLERLPVMVSAKRDIAARYDAAIRGRNDMRPMPRPEHSQSSCWLYSMQLATEAEATTLVAALDAAGVESRIFWRSLSGQEPWRHAPHHLRGVSEMLSGTVVSLPSSSSLSFEDQTRVIAVLESWRGKGRLAA